MEISLQEELAKTKAELESVRSNFNSIVEQNADGLLVVNKDGVVCFANPAAGLMLSRETKDLVGKDFGFPVAADKMMEISLLQPNKKIRTAEMRISKTIWQRQPAQLIMIRDVTDRKQSEEKLRILSQAVEQSANVIIITDKKGNIQYVNPAFTKVTGYTSEEALGKNPRILKSGEMSPATYEKFWATISSGHQWEGIFHNKKKDGGFYQAQAWISPVKNQEGDISHYVGVQLDVTRQKLLERELYQSQKMEAIGQLAGSVAHDFSNLLTVINGYSEFLMSTFNKDFDKKNKYHFWLQQIHDAGKRASNLTQRLLAFSRRQIVATKVFNVNTLILDLSRMLKRLIGADVELVVLVDEHAGMIKADPSQIEQVILNLAVNARDAMPKGGVLTLKTSHINLDGSFCRPPANLSPGEYVVIEVSDNGCGISEEVKTHLFEPFFTTKPKEKGTGLGLATSYGIVKQSNGHIFVESESGHGATFKIYLPYCHEMADLLVVEKRFEKIPEGTETILLVEDEDQVRSFTTSVLRKYGYDVLEAENGEKALRVIAESGQKKIDLVITDVIMPYLGGRELTEKIHEKYPDMKILFISGYLDDAIAHRIVTESRVEFLQKPFEATALACKVREVLDK